MDEIRLFIGGLKNVGNSPYALAAYVALLVAWVLIVFRIRRNQQLLQNLEKLPEKDRLSALRLEMGSAILERGMNPSEYIALQTRRYLLFGFFSVVVVAAILIVASFIYKDSGKVSIDVTPVVSLGGRDLREGFN